MTLDCYSRSLAAFFCAWVALVWILAASLESPDGDLARVGGFPESRFRTTQPQTAFEKNHFRIARELSDLDRPYDVVVLGDSFSCDQESRRFGWQNYLAQRTGWSVITFDTRRFWPAELFASEQFRKFPPRLFVFQSAERYLPMRTTYLAGAPAKQEPPAPARRAGPLPPPAPTDARTEILTPKGRISWNTDEALGFLSAWIWRHLGLDRRVLDVPLTRGDLFSNPMSSRLLVYYDEEDKKRLGPRDLADLRAGLGCLERQAAHAGAGRTVFLVAPDKTSLYAPWFADPGKATPNLVAHAAQDPSLPIVRTDRVFEEALRAGERDSYLPDDSHWSSRGNQLAADALLQSLDAAPVH